MLRKSKYFSRFINPASLALGLLTILTAFQVKAFDSANEAAWLNHLKSINAQHTIKQPFNTGNSTYFGFTEKWDALVTQGEKNFRLTQEDFRLLHRKLTGEHSPRNWRKLNYQADIADKLLHIRFFYHF